MARIAKPMSLQIQKQIDSTEEEIVKVTEKLNELKEKLNTLKINKRDAQKEELFLLLDEKEIDIEELKGKLLSQTAE